MLATFVQSSDTIDYIPPADLAAGSVVVIGSLVAISKRNLRADNLGALSTTGTFDVTKAPVAITAGSRLYWDSVHQYASPDSQGGTLPEMGLAVQDAANTANLVRMILNP